MSIFFQACSVISRLMYLYTPGIEREWRLEHKRAYRYVFRVTIRLGQPLVELALMLWLFTCQCN